MRALCVLVCMLLLTRVASAQPANAASAFDAADVHVSARVRNPAVRGGYYAGGRYELHNATMVDLIRYAWSLNDNGRVIGGPAWIEDDRFDVIAKAPNSSTRETANQMLRTLLADRFRLVVHEDNRLVSAYALTVGKRALVMKPSPPDPDAATHGCQVPAGAAPGSGRVCRGMTMTKFAVWVQSTANAYFGDYQVVDLTGLTGQWNFNINWTARARLSDACSAGISIFDAVDKYMGLRLALQDVPLPVIVVDRANEKPTENPPGVTKKLTVSFTEFDVADIKPSAPDEKSFENIQPGGRIDLRATTLRELIKYAWNIEDDDLLAGGPKWVDSTRFSVLARAPSEDPAKGPTLDEDDLRLMMRNLLTSRFHLTTHSEIRPATVYALSANKAKLKKADPANRTSCRGTPGAAGAASPLSRSYTCRNVTMPQLHHAPAGG